MNRDFTIPETKQKILNTFKYYTQGPSVPSDGNCGLHAICKALGDGLRLTGSSVNSNSLMLDIFNMFDLQNLPYYWWSDEELAVIANNFGYDMYIYNETDGTGIVYGKSIRQSLVLYSVNDNSHWIPGIKTTVPSSYIPKNFTIIENISEVLSIKQIQIKIKWHLLMRSLNPSEGCMGRNSVRYNGSRSSSNERRVVGSNRKQNRSRSVERDEAQDGSHSGISSSRGHGNVQILRQYGSGPKLEKGHYDNGVENSHSAGEKESHNGGEESNSRKSDEKWLAQNSSPVNDDQSYGIHAIKRELRLFAKLKNTVLSKVIRQLYHWNRNKKNKYRKLDLCDSEDEVDHFEDTKLNIMYNARYTTIQDMLHQSISKNERQLLALEACNTLVALQSLELTMFQLKPSEYPQFDTIETEYPMVDVNCYPTSAVDCCTIATVDQCSIEPSYCCSDLVVVCCSNATVDCCMNEAVNYPYNTYVCPYTSNNYPFFSTSCPWNIDDCPFTAPEYSFSDNLVSDRYVDDLLYSYTFGRNKIKRDQLLNRVYNLAKTMSNNAIVRYIIKPKRVVVAPPPAVLMAPAVITSVVPTSVFTSPAMVAPAMVALMMAAPEVATLKMIAMTVPVTPLGNDLTATQMENNLTVSSVVNDSEVKPNVCVKRHFSLKKIWKKKTKTQYPKDH